MTNKKQRSIDLINYEGPVLKLIESGEDVIVVDQWETTIAKLNFVSLMSYLNGDITLYDKRGRGWNYTLEHPESKTNINRVLEFYSSLRNKENV